MTIIFWIIEYCRLDMLISLSVGFSFAFGWILLLLYFAYLLIAFHHFLANFISHTWDDILHGYAYKIIYKCVAYEFFFIFVWKILWRLSLETLDNIFCIYFILFLYSFLLLFNVTFATHTYIYTPQLNRFESSVKNHIIIRFILFSLCHANVYWFFAVFAFLFHNFFFHCQTCYAFISFSFHFWFLPCVCIVYMYVCS